MVICIVIISLGIAIFKQSHLGNDSITALNAIMADSLGHAADFLEGDLARGKDLNAAIQHYVQHVIEEHSAVIFNGDGYSSIWHAEAERRGLPNLRTTPEAMPELIRPEVIDLYERLGILNRAELKARYDIYLDCLLYTSPSPRDMRRYRMPSSA